MSALRLLATLAVATSISTATVAQQPPASQLPFHDALNMTVLVYKAAPPPTPGMGPVVAGDAVGSGVWVGKAGYVATCQHVIANWSGPFKIGVTRNSFVTEGDSRITAPATVVVFDAALISSDPDTDVAILKAAIAPADIKLGHLVTGNFTGTTLITPMKGDVPTGATLKTDFPPPGEAMLLAGFPLGEKNLILQTGTATGIDFLPPQEISVMHGASGLRIFLSLVSNPGNSGGLVVDADGKLVGLLEGNLQSPIRDKEGRQVYTPTFKLDAAGNPTRDASGQYLFDVTPLKQNAGISFAVPARFIADLAKKNNINLD